MTCLSCHRAHASGFPEMLRWNMKDEFMVYDGLFPGTDTTPTGPQFAPRPARKPRRQAAYYDRPATSLRATSACSATSATRRTRAVFRFVRRRRRGRFAQVGDGSRLREQDPSPTCANLPRHLGVGGLKTAQPFSRAART